jgi:hypothetical protein
MSTNNPIQADHTIIPYSADPTSVIEICASLITDMQILASTLEEQGHPTHLFFVIRTADRHHRISQVQ